MTKTILLADDSLTIQKVVELTFADTQYHVVAVSSGDELLEKLPEVQPEVVICDIIMPGRDGYEICSEIKSNPGSLHIPVILLSGTFEPFDRDRALAAGCSEIITKPFEAKKLVDAVEKLFGSPVETAQVDSTAELASGLEPATPAPEVDFGTRLTDQEPETEELPADDSSTEADAESPDDGIDFTTSGFAEMEAAAGAMASPSTELSAAGIDSDVTAAPGAVADSPTNGDPVSTDDDEFADAFSQDGPDFGSSNSDPDPFSTTEDPGAPDGSEESHDGPFADAFVPEDGSAGDEESTVGFELKTAEEAFADEPAPIILTDADTAPVPPMDEEIQDQTPAVEVPTSPDPVDEDETTDVEAAPSLPLSDEDVDRIARRVMDLAFDQIEQVAWEVIPDVAEVAVRERIRQLESEFETEN